MQCNCGGSTVDKTSNTKQEDESRLIVKWSECTSCGRTLVIKREVISDK